MTQWPSDAPRRVSRIPRFHPGADALLQVRNDLIGDARVNVLSLVIHGLFSSLGPVIRTAEDQKGRANRGGPSPHCRETANTGAPSLCGANGAGSAVDGTPRTAQGRGNTVRCDRI